VGSSRRPRINTFVCCFFTGYSFLIWFIRAVLTPDRVRFVRCHLLRRADPLSAGSSTAPLVGVEDTQALVQFVGDYLRVDGVFLLRLIAHNTNGVAVAEITLALWNDWCERRMNGRNTEADSSGILTVPRRLPSVE